MPHKYDFQRCPDLLGRRYILPPHGATVTRRPASVDLRSKLPPVFDQGQEGSCGPNSADGLMCFFHPDVPGFSRQQIYYSVRAAENDINQDGGVMTKDLFAILNTVGAAPESLWPYTETFTVKPTDVVMTAAAQYKINSFGQLVSEEDFLDCLAGGQPFILGFEVYDSFEGDIVATTGVWQRPDTLIESDLGGHDVLVCGYDTNFLQNPDFLNSNADPVLCNNTALLIRNSWGADWGLKGYFWMPIDYASSAQTGGDCWTGKP